MRRCSSFCVLEFVVDVVVCCVLRKRCSHVLHVVCFVLCVVGLLLVVCCSLFVVGCFVLDACWLLLVVCGL